MGRLLRLGGQGLSGMGSQSPESSQNDTAEQIHISSLALLKMMKHGRAGVPFEVMGLMLGDFVDDYTVRVADVFAMPQSGTGVSVEAVDPVFQAKMLDMLKQTGRHEMVVGWYHSHPGCGGWLSGIDVSTQALNQNFQDPFVAIVIDPVRTISAGKVSLGAFRTYPKGYKPPDEGPSEYQTIPLNKIEDFGVHCKSYYQLEVSYFKSPMDTKLLENLWNHYWVNTLSASSLITNAEYTTGQVRDLADKLESWDHNMSRGSYAIEREGSDKKTEDKLSKATKDSCKITTEVLHGIMTQVVKDKLFNCIQK
jgi:COP9 signalosome complex subunit 5